MKLIVTSLLVSMAVGGAAIAGPKAKTPPPPVPTYWIGEFTLGDDVEAEAGKQQSGFATVKAADAPENAIVVKPLDPKHPTAPEMGLGDNPRIYSTEGLTPAFDDRIREFPRVLIVDQATNPTPALIKNKKIEKAVRKQQAKDRKKSGNAELKRSSMGIADLDADGIADVALIFGCYTNEFEECEVHDTQVYERAGAGWKEIQVASDDQ